MVKAGCLGRPRAGTCRDIGQSGTHKSRWRGACGYRIRVAFLDLTDPAKLVGQRRTLHNGSFQMVSSPDVRRLDYLYSSIRSALFKFLDCPVLRYSATPNLAPARRPRGKGDVWGISKRIPCICGTNGKVFSSDMESLMLINAIKRSASQRHPGAGRRVGPLIRIVALFQSVIFESLQCA